MQYDLSVLIPARNEEWLSRTVEDVLKNKRGKTEIIVGLDGCWSDPPIIDHPDVTIIYHNLSVGQRRITKECAILARGKYLMKLDAHCRVSEGFDLPLLSGFQELGDNVTQIPVLYNLHLFDWKCKKCGNQWYQSPTPTHCMMIGESRKNNPNCNSTEFEKVVIWKPRWGRKSECYRFDTEPHFQYHRDWSKKYPTGDYIETMSAQGSCFVMTKEKYFNLNIDDETWGSWGSQGISVACKTWLSGGRLVTNRKCWYSHAFRTQGGDFGFPYPQSGNQVGNAKKIARDLFFNNRWDGQVYPLSWLVDKFQPLPDWHTPKYEYLLEDIRKKGREFYANKAR